MFGRAFSCDKTTLKILFRPRTTGCSLSVYIHRTDIRIARMHPARTYAMATCPKRQNTTLAHLLRDSSFDPQFCLSWGIRFEAFFDDFFCSQNGGGRGKATHQPLQVQNPSFVDYPERSIVKRGCHSPHISRLQRIQSSVLLFR